MEKDKLRLVTSLADGELKDGSELSYVQNLIETEKDLNYDYQVQLFIKSILSEKLKTLPVPHKIKDKVIRKINPGKKFFTFFSK